MPTRFPLPEAIRTPRLLLRPWRPADASGLQIAVATSRARLDPWMPWTTFYDHPSAAAGFIQTAQASWAARGDLNMAITDAETGMILGGCGLHRFSYDLGVFETGYWLRTGAEGAGFASEATRAMTRLVFGPLGGQRLRIQCDRRNDRSRQVAESLGFIFELCARNDARGVDGAPRDTLVFSLIAANGEAERVMASWPKERFDLTWPANEPDAAVTPGAPAAEPAVPEIAASFPRPAEIGTPRLRLRPAAPADAPALLALLDRSHPHLEPWLDWVRDVRDAAGAERVCHQMADDWAARRRFDLLAFRAEDGALVGSGALHRCFWEVPAAEVDWWLGAEATGAGYATEIGGALVRFLFEAWGVIRAEVWIDATNDPSRRVAARIGFHEEGVARREFPNADGILADWWIASITPEEYAALAPSLPPIETRVE